MKEVIEILEERAKYYEEWLLSIEADIARWENELLNLESNKSLALKSIESINEAIWKLQIETS